MAITLSQDGYCVLADVQALIQQFTISAVSAPTSTEVEGFITQGFSETNALLIGAGYVAPVSQAGGSLQVASGNITVQTATIAGASSLTATGTGLAGSAKRGDFFVVGSDPQRYMVTEITRANTSNQIALYFSPALELDAAGGATITYTAATNAAQVLKQLNAHLAAIQTIHSAYSSSAEGVGELTAPLGEERDRLMAGIVSGRYDLPAIEAADTTAAGVSNVFLRRA